jgi:hypothetical protein
LNLTADWFPNLIHSDPVGVPDGERATQQIRVVSDRYAICRTIDVDDVLSTARCAHTFPLADGVVVDALCVPTTFASRSTMSPDEVATPEYFSTKSA